jgi:uncharacterized protein YjbJ (UPF0337 family)
MERQCWSDSEHVGRQTDGVPIVKAVNGRKTVAIDQWHSSCLQIYTTLMTPPVARMAAAIQAARQIKGAEEMNWEQIKGKWQQAKGHVQEKWGDLTDDDLQVVNGKREQLVGKVQERYGIAKEEAERQVDEFEKSCNC